LDWPDDVVDAADQLGLERFAVQGLSAGGPFALACARKIPDRLMACGLISTVSSGALIRKAGPGWMRMVWWFGERFPNLFRFYLRVTVTDTAPSIADNEKRLLQYSAYLAEPDKKLIKSPGPREALAQAFTEARRQGGQGERDSATALMLPWGFEMDEIGFEPVCL
jgi:pimeloyl-ACP methyl ester carboxylesterase